MVQEKPLKNIWDVNFDNKQLPHNQLKQKLILSIWLDIQTFKVEDGDKDENNKSISFCKDDEKLLEKQNDLD